MIETMFGWMRCSHMDTNDAVVEFSPVISINSAGDV